jgi:hypothetical protein
MLSFPSFTKKKYPAIQPGKRLVAVVSRTAPRGRGPGDRSGQLSGDFDVAGRRGGAGLACVRDLFDLAHRVFLSMFASIHVAITSHAIYFSMILAFINGVLN